MIHEIKKNIRRKKWKYLFIILSISSLFIVDLLLENEKIYKIEYSDMDLQKLIEENEEYIQEEKYDLINIKKKQIENKVYHYAVENKFATDKAYIQQGLYEVISLLEMKYEKNKYSEDEINEGRNIMAQLSRQKSEIFIMN